MVKQPVAKPTFNMYECDFDCEHDTYDETFRNIINFSVSSKLPDSFEKLTQKERLNKRASLRTRSIQFRLFKCGKGTLHLWRIPTNAKSSKSTSIPSEESSLEIWRPEEWGYRRIPMLREC